MGVFKKTKQANPDGLDWDILQNGYISLYWKSSILDEDLKWFDNENYVVVEFNCKLWSNDTIMHAQFKGNFGFPEYYGGNFNALKDYLSDLKIVKTGLVVVFRHLDNIKTKTAQSILEIMADNSRFHMLFGERIITIVQVDNPDVEFEFVGKNLISWNGKEWLNSNRI